jgi:hypothetical protein
MAHNFTAASSQYLSTASTPVTTFPCTLACWFKITTTTTANVLVSLQETNGQSRLQLGVNGTTTPKRAVQAAVINSSGTVGIVGVNETTYLANTWYHSCGVFSSASVVNAYLDGNIGILTGSSAITPTGINQVLIGARFATSLGQFHDGVIAEVGIWNAALTAAEIASLAKGMTPDKIRPQNLVFYAPLVRDINDQKGGRTITNNNGVTVANHTRVYA